MKMKEFWSVNGKSVVMLYVNQIAMSVFGIMVIGAAGSREGDTLLLLASVLSVGLYLFIIYSMMWEAGAKAAAKTLRAEDSGVKKIETPFFIVLFGSAFNIVCYSIYTVSRITGAEAAGGMVEILIRLTNFIYMGFESLLYRENIVMRVEPYYFFLTLVPLFAVGIGAYYLGASEISVLRKLGFKPNKSKSKNK